MKRPRNSHAGRDDLGTVPPTFCPRCRREGPNHAALCPECGESLVKQGYCEICEQLLRYAEGERCPKHDLPLLADRPPEKPPSGFDEEYTAWVTMAVFGHPIAAEAPRIRLEAEGIPTFLQGERMGANSLYQGATGGVKLQVPSSRADEARILLGKWAPPADPEEWDDHFDEEEPTQAAPSSRGEVLKAVILLLFALPFLVGFVMWLFA